MPVVYVTGDVAGAKESPVYAILEMKKNIDAITLPEGYKIVQHTANIPSSDRKYAMKWDGEWHSTFASLRMAAVSPTANSLKIRSDSANNVTEKQLLPE